MGLKVPILPSVQSTLSRWAAELRGTAFVLFTDLISKSWQPTIRTNTAGAGVVITDTSWAKYIKIGNWVFVIVRVVVTTSGVATSEIILDLPSSFFTAGVGCFAVAIVDGGGTIAGAGSLGDDAGVRITRYDALNFGVGAGRIIRIFGAYEITNY